MKALTALPTQAYVQVGEEANVPLQDLLRLVQELETNVSPAYIARYRPEVAAGLSADRIQTIQNRLRSFLDLADRRVTILTAINQQGRLTPELREQIEGSMNRRELEDLYLPFKPKRRTAADEAVEKGREALAMFLWKQESADELEAEAAKHATAEGDTPEAALAGACDIIARWLGENAEIRRDIRKIAHAEAEIAVETVEPKRRLSGRDENQRKRFAGMNGYRASVAKAPWRQVLSLRRGAREGWLEYRIELPEERALQYLEGRLLRSGETVFAPHLKIAAKKAFDGYLAPTIESELRQELDERCDSQAIELYKKNLRKLLLAAPAGPRTIVGLETNRPGGWRAAVIGADGALLEAAIVREDPDAKPAEEPVAAPAKDSEAKTEAQAEPAPEAKPPETAESQEAEAETPVAEGAEPQDAEAAAEQPAVEAATDESSATEEADTKAEEPAVETAPATEAPAAEQPPQEPQAEAAAVEEPKESAEAAVTAAPEAAALEVPVETEAKPEEPAEAQGALQFEASAPVAEAPAAASEGAAATAPAVESAEAPQPAPEPVNQASKPAPKPEKKSAPTRKETPHGDLAELIARHEADLVVFGNGPGLRQVERVVRLAVKKSGRACSWLAANEAGSWIYATSKGARKEMPDQEPAVRSAACLARRVQDPMGELIKLDPRVLGIGQGHHEVDQKSLRNALREAQESAIQDVGVDVNSAPAELLALVPGMTERVAKRIVEHRRKNGPFSSRAALSEMSGLNARVYGQAAGFLRVYGGENPLDATGVHPRDYGKLEEMLKASGVDAQQAIDDPSKLAEVSLSELADKAYSERALKVIRRELDPRMRNPRGVFEMPTATTAVEPIEEPKAGMKVEGVITNVADFGLFVDIGAEQDGLVHVSQLSAGVTREGEGAVKTGDRITVYVVNVANGG